MSERSSKFLYECWYVAGWAADLQPADRVGRTFLNEPIVLFRTEDGHIGALEDRCCHRAMQLSHGLVVGETIRCTYHGLEFDQSGVCVRIPAQDKIPASACVRSYRVVERDGMIWIWMGTWDRADESRIPRHLTHQDPRYAWRSAHFPVAGNWQLLIDNLMDLSHLPYIHPNTIGGNPELHFKTKTEASRTEKGVRVTRYMPSSVPPPTYVAAKRFPGLVDRWQEIEFEPGLIRIHTGACEVGTGAYDGRRDHGFSMIGFHGITPETETTTHYFWSMATNILDNGIPDLVFRQTADTFREDQTVLDLQQQRISLEPERGLLDIASDNGGRLARQQLSRLMKDEQATKKPSFAEYA